MSVSIRQLQAFSAVAELGSFVEAARLLGVSASALSALIRGLETQLGLRLFDRTTRRVLLSDAGRMYLQYAERLLADLRQSEAFVQDLRGGRTGVVRLAATQLMNWVLLPPVLRAFHARWPKVRIDLVDVPTHEIVSSVETGQADLAIAFRMPVGDGCEAVPLFTSRVSAVLPAEHPLAGRSRLAWRDLKGQPLIFIGRGSELRIRSELPAGLGLVSMHEVNSTITAVGLVAGGAGVAVCSGYVRPMLDLHGLKSLPLAGPVIERQFMLYRNRSRGMPPAMETFREFLRTHFARLGPKPVEQSQEPDGA